MKITKTQLKQLIESAIVLKEQKASSGDISDDDAAFYEAYYEATEALWAALDQKYENGMDTLLSEILESNGVPGGLEYLDYSPSDDLADNGDAILMPLFRKHYKW